jgi:hypothetical protein
LLHLKLTVFQLQEKCILYFQNNIQLHGTHTNKMQFMPVRTVRPSLCYFHKLKTYSTVSHAQIWFWNLAKPDNRHGQYGQIFIYVPQKSITFTELNFMNSQTLTNICGKSSAWNSIQITGNTENTRAKFNVHPTDGMSSTMSLFTKTQSSSMALHRDPM